MPKISFPVSEEIHKKIKLFASSNNISIKKLLLSSFFMHKTNAMRRKESIYATILNSRKKTGSTGG